MLLDYLHSLHVMVYNQKVTSNLKYIWNRHFCYTLDDVVKTILQYVLSKFSAVGSTHSYLVLFYRLVLFEQLCSLVL